MSAGRPQVPEGIGMKPQFKNLKLELMSHKDAEFTTGDNVFDIEIKSPNAVQTTFKLFHYDAQSKETEFPSSVFTQMKGDKITFYLALERTGWYKFNIFAKPFDDVHKSLDCVFTYLFDLTAIRKPVHPYPKQFSDWKRGCYLYEPLFLDTSKDLKEVEFEVEVPSARRVAVKAGDKWTHLEKKGDNTWKGKVSLQHYVGTSTFVDLNACTSSDETKFSTLLRYSL